MVTITAWNMKGGTGKTTTTFNVAAELARQGKKVLCLDLDIQANLTSYFDKDIQKCKSSRPDIAEIIASDIPLKKGIYHSRFQNLHFIKNNNTTIDPKNIFTLSNLLLEIMDLYDVCLIDCHPDSTPVCQMAIAAADLVLIPILLDGFSRDNLNLVLREINAVENLTGKDIKYKIVVNRLRNLKSQRAIFSDLIKQHDYPLLNTSITDYAGVQSSLLLHKPVALHRSRSQAGKDYQELAAELMQVLGVM